jgi:acetyltransferase-like isoleucine patch superfamily enzyme
MLKKIKKLIREIAFIVLSERTRPALIRSYGVKMGKDCLIFTNHFSTEPYLIEIGDHVVISEGTQFITHDGSVWVFRDSNPDLDVFGRIMVGSNTFFGINCIILPNTTIGNNCIIGAGSVVRGNIPDNSVVMGNPAKVVLKTELMEKLVQKNKNALMTKHMRRSKKDAYIRKHFNIKD